MLSTLTESGLPTKASTRMKAAPSIRFGCITIAFLKFGTPAAMPPIFIIESSSLTKLTSLAFP